MASSPNPGGPVLVQHTSAPHALSPEVTVVSISGFSLGLQNHPPVPDAVPSSAFASTSHQHVTDSTTPTPELIDTEMADAPLASPEVPSEPIRETNVESILHRDPRPTTEESSGRTPDQMDEGGHNIVRAAEQLDQDSSEASSEASNQNSEQGLRTPPPPHTMAQQSQADVPVWVTWDDDLSAPTEDEMNELNLREARGSELSALDVPGIEKRIYEDVDDPEQRPVKKLRLSWVIRGVRGTRDNPNYARVMVSPPAKVDGNYWQIKFYPRGNKCSSLSAYIRCSRKPPKEDLQIPNGTFSFFEGPPDAELGSGAIPSQTLTIGSGHGDNSVSKTTNIVASSGFQKADDHQSFDYPSASVQQDTGNDSRDATRSVEADWRVPAQLGLVMYNPDEPRTCTYMSSQHQFSESNDDWGWTNFVGPWSDIHNRQHLQRQPLLRNDTIAIDAYIRIFDDPTKALWWHPSDTETHWDSKSLTGYYPMGTPPLYHSPAVAGMTAWLLLAPFRKVIQQANAGEWRHNSRAPPRPVVCQLQMILFLMRSLKKGMETYVDVHPVIQTIKELGETYPDVKTFWEVLRRTVELELEGDHRSLEQLSNIFDTADGPVSLPPLPVQGVKDIQQGLEQTLAAANFKGRLPNFLPLFLARQRFDATAREWKLLRDRVVLNEQLDVSKYCTDGEQARYTLYGFVVHVGGRNSGAFYSVLRPNGPNTKWLAFEDGDGNKIFSYTRKRVQEFEGLEGRALREDTPTSQTAYMAMYIKTGCLSEYLPGKLEPYTLPGWLVPHLHSQYRESDVVPEDDKENAKFEHVDVEVYLDQGILGQEGLLNLFTLQRQCQQKGQVYTLCSPRSATFQELRIQLAKEIGLEEPEKIRLFLMKYIGIGQYPSTQLFPVNWHDLASGEGMMDQPLRLWMTVLKTEEELELFAENDSHGDRQSAQRGPSGAVDSTDIEDSEAADEEQLAGPDAEQASVHAAVAADVERTAAQPGQASYTQSGDDDQDTPMQLEVHPPTVEESLIANVPHGHLIDAAAHTGERPAGHAGTHHHSLQPSAEEATVPPVSAGDAAVIVMDLGSEAAMTTEETSATNASPESSETTPVEPQKPLERIYGFVQAFDVDKQNFIVRSTFVAGRDNNVRDIIRRCMDWPEEKDFMVWRRESGVQCTTIGPDETFDDSRYHNGIVIIAGEQLSKARVKELHKEGKFSDPYVLSWYLRMVDRKHPVSSKTTSEPIELAEFGSEYYKGPLVNGRAHGQHCLCISSSGETYEGPLVCNLKCGKGGKMTYRTGDTYDGEWDEGERHGQGTFVEYRTGNKYVGGFEYGKRWGMGTTYWQVADEQADLCQICYSQEIDALFFDCGHVCSCVECARQCDICPICRKTVKQVVKMFRA